MPPDASADLARYLIPLGVVAIVIVARNSRPRRLKIERLWVTPAIYLVLLASALTSAPPPLTPLSVAILVAGFAIGAAIGWQRARFTQIHIHPDTHDLTSRASPIGILFIFAILVVRYAARDYLKGSDAADMHLPIVAISDGFLLLAIGTLTAQRLEIWQRASRMLAEAKAASGPPPPQSIVS